MQIDILKKNNLLDQLLLMLVLFLFSSMITIFKLANGDILRWLSLGILILFTWLTSHKKKERIILFDFSFIFLILMIIPSMTVWFVEVHTFLRAISLFLVIMALFWFFGRTSVTKVVLEDYLKIFLYVLYLFSLINFAYFVAKENFVYGRFWGIYTNPNAMSTITIFVLTLSIYFFKKTKNIVYLIGTIVSLILVIATGSRTGLLSIGLIIFLYPIVFNSKKGFSLFRNIFAVLAILILLWVFITNFRVDALERLYSQGYTRDEWKAGFNYFQNKPFLGWGYGWSSFIISQNPFSSDWGMHNSYLILLAETGMWGALMFMNFIVVTIFRLVTSLRLADIQEKVFIKVCALVLINLGVNGMTEAFLFSVGNPMSIIFWFTLILMNRYVKLVKQNTTNNILHT